MKLWARSGEFCSRRSLPPTGCLANGVNPKIVGVNVIDMKDADGKPFIREILKMANEKGNGWQDYKWPDPVQKTIRNKSSYVEKIDDWYVCAGIYK